jgi:hypothetical protein
LLSAHSRQRATLAREGLESRRRSDGRAEALGRNACGRADEFVFRFNRRRSGSRGLLFCRLMEQAGSDDAEAR